MENIRRKNWKNQGYTTAELRHALPDCANYQPMEYVLSDRVKSLGVGYTILEHTPETDLILECHTSPNVNKKAIHTDNWKRGVEASRPYYFSLMLPRCLLTYVKRVQCSTLNCMVASQRYYAVNLTRPPEMGFKHIKLQVSNYPTLIRSEVQGLLSLKSVHTRFFGAVCTIRNLDGVFLQKMASVDTGGLFGTILDMHTSLQVHPFVPRTFALHITKTPLHTDSVGVFVGERLGEWHLGQEWGPALTNDGPTLAYEIIQCLLKAQIVFHKVLGFTMSLIQPPRIWKWDKGGFRIDFTGCLADTMLHLVSREPPKETYSYLGDATNLGAILNTMIQLNLLEYLPEVVINTLLNRVKAPRQA